MTAAMGWNGSRNRNTGESRATSTLRYCTANSVLRFTKSCWVGKHINTVIAITKPMNSQPKANPTQTKKRLKKWHLGLFFSHSK